MRLGARACRGAVMLLCAVVAALGVTSMAAKAEEAITPIPQGVALGRRLFNDKGLSVKGDISCASCHPLDRGGADGLRHVMQIGASRLMPASGPQVPPEAEPVSTARTRFWKSA